MQLWMQICQRSVCISKVILSLPLRLDRNFSFSIHILFDNWVKNSFLLGSLRTSEGVKPLFSSTVSSSVVATKLALFVFVDLSWLIVVIDEKCCLNPLKLVCFPNFCLKTLKGSDWVPVLLVTTAILLFFKSFFTQPDAKHSPCLVGKMTGFWIFIVINIVQDKAKYLGIYHQFISTSISFPEDPV